jgi:hypothetical protein
MSLVDFLGYNLFFPSVIAGPTFSFTVYLDLINCKYDNSLKSMKVISALKPFFISLPLCGLAFFTLPYFHPRWVL